MSLICFCSSFYYLLSIPKLVPSRCLFPRHLNHHLPRQLFKEAEADNCNFSRRVRRRQDGDHKVHPWVPLLVSNPLLSHPRPSCIFWCTQWSSFAMMDHQRWRRTWHHNCRILRPPKLMSPHCTVSQNLVSWKISATSVCSLSLCLRAISESRPHLINFHAFRPFLIMLLPFRALPSSRIFTPPIFNLETFWEVCGDMKWSLRNWETLVT